MWLVSLACKGGVGGDGNSSVFCLLIPCYAINFLFIHDSYYLEVLEKGTFYYFVSKLRKELIGVMLWGITTIRHDVGMSCLK